MMPRIGCSTRIFFGLPNLQLGNREDRSRSRLQHARIHFLLAVHVLISLHKVCTARNKNYHNSIARVLHHSGSQRRPCTIL